jgi:hypothetical protein
MSLWIIGAIGVTLALIGVAYLEHVRKGGSIMHRYAPAIIALAIFGVVFNELVLIPRFGSDAGTSITSTFIFCVILPLTVYLSNKRSKY